MRWVALIALACVAAAGELDVQLPAASAARRPAEGAFSVSLTAEGLVLVDKEGRPERLSLDQLAVRLRERRAAAPKPADMPVAIRADEKAPYLQVQRLVEICAEEKLRRIELGVKGPGGEEGWLAAHLPGDEKALGDIAKVTVRIAVTRDQPAVYGPAQTAIALPTELSYRIGEGEAKDMDAVRRYIRDAGQTAAQNGDVIAGTIAPATRIPWGAVVEVLNEFRRAGIEEIRFARIEPAATPEERRATRLSYPK